MLVKFLLDIRVSGKTHPVSVQILGPIRLFFLALRLLDRYLLKHKLHRKTTFINHIKNLNGLHTCRKLCPNG